MIGRDFDGARIRDFGVGEDLELRHGAAQEARQQPAQMAGTSSTAGRPICFLALRRRGGFAQQRVGEPGLDAAAVGAAPAPCTAWPSTRSRPGSSAITCISLPPG